jgi:hypothetical protein
MHNTLRTLRALANGGANGELVAISGASEIRVYVLEGRIAWASSRKASCTLTHYLLEQCCLTRTQLREVVEECGRTRQPLGETLVSRNLATLEQVRAALAQQIHDVLGLLEVCCEVRSVFIPRALRYAKELTFPLSEILGARRPAPIAPPALRSSLAGGPIAATP